MTMGKDYAGWFSLAASPSFAVMAAITVLDGGGLCLSAPGASPMSGMTGMYLLMCFFSPAALVSADCPPGGLPSQFQLHGE